MRFIANRIRGILIRLLGMHVSTDGAPFDLSRKVCRLSCTLAVDTAIICSTICILVITSWEHLVMPRFTPGELKVMRLLWEHGELKPPSSRIVSRADQESRAAVVSHDAARERPRHPASRGKAYYYKAVTRSRSAFRTMLGELVDTYCGGSIQALVMNIIKSERLSEDDLLELKRLADEGDPQPPLDRRSRK